MAIGSTCLDTCEPFLMGWERWQGYGATLDLLLLMHTNKVSVSHESKYRNWFTRNVDVLRIYNRHDIPAINMVRIRNSLPPGDAVYQGTSLMP